MARSINCTPWWFGARQKKKSSTSMHNTRGSARSPALIQQRRLPRTSYAIHQDLAVDAEHSSLYYTARVHTFPATAEGQRMPQLSAAASSMRTLRNTSCPARIRNKHPRSHISRNSLRHKRGPAAKVCSEGHFLQGRLPTKARQQRAR